MKMRFLKLILISFLILMPKLAFSADVCEININGLEHDNTKRVAGLLNIKQGDQFNPDKFKQGVENIKSWGALELVSADYREESDCVNIDLELKDFVIVASIDISGNFPYLERKIRRYLTLYPGDPYSEEKVQEQSEIIENFYRRHGHIETKVYVEESSKPDVNGIALNFHIKSGKVLRYSDINITGNNAFPDGRIITYIKTWRPYSKQTLKRGIREAQEYYRHHGYPQAKISIKEETIDFENARVNVLINVNEGPKLDTKFIGYKRIPNKTLKKSLTFADNGRIDKLSIDESCENITKLFVDKGYPDVKCDGNREKTNDGYLVNFLIDTNKPQIISKINFKGLKDAKSKPIKEKMINKENGWKISGAFYPDRSEEDNSIILEELKNQGFLEAQVGEWEINIDRRSNTVEITIPVREEKRTTVSKIQLVNATKDEARKIKRSFFIEEKKPYSELSALKSKDEIINFYGNNGYPYSEVDLEVTIEKNRAELVYKINKGPFVKIGEIVFVGDIMTSQKALQRAILLKQGDPFSFKKIVESQIEIQKLGSFLSAKVEPIGLQEKETTIHLNVKVVEQRPFVINTTFGYSTDDSFIGTFQFTNINAFGWAKQQGLKLTGGEKFSRGEIFYYDPRFFSSSFELGTNAWTQYKKRPAFTYIQIGGSAGFYRRYKALTLLIKEQLARNYHVTGNTLAADKESLRDNTISELTLAMGYDTRDSFGDPRKGLFINPSVQIYNEIKGNEANFAGFSLNNEWDMSLWRFTSMTAGRFNRLQEIGDNVSIPTPYLLFMGGDDTIRGFATDSLGPKNAKGEAIGGRLRWVVNQEIRLRILKSWQIIGFYDMGSLTNDFDDFNLDSVRNSAGFGIRYMTPVGPIRADYGIKLDRKTNESFGRFHLTFGYMF